ncbi:MAG: alpha-tubulin suppressor-like RCC1 family protein, partial [Ilumatobacter sp.]
MFSLTIRRFVRAAAALGLVASGVVVGLVPAVATAANNSEAKEAATGMADPMIATGAHHSCAVLNTGDVACWGYNYYGQLGNSTTSGLSSANPDPTLVGLPAGTTATAVTA